MDLRAGFGPSQTNGYFWCAKAVSQSTGNGIWKYSPRPQLAAQFGEQITSEYCIILLHLVAEEIPGQRAHRVTVCYSTLTSPRVYFMRLEKIDARGFVSTKLKTAVLLVCVHYFPLSILPLPSRLWLCLDHLAKKFEKKILLIWSIK